MGPVKPAVVRSSVTPWRDGGKSVACLGRRKWANRFSVKDMLNFFVASILKIPELQNVQSCKIQHRGLFILPIVTMFFFVMGVYIANIRLSKKEGGYR